MLASSWWRRLRRRRWQTSRSPRRSRRNPLKPLRRECRVNRCDRGDYARMLFYFACEAAGASSARHSLRPLLRGSLSKTRAHCAARTRSRSLLFEIQIGNSLEDDRTFLKSRWSSVELYLRSAEQFDVERAAREQHIVQRFTDVIGFDGLGAIPHDACLCHAPHQLFNEGGTDALCPLRGLGHHAVADRQSLAIELYEFPAADIIWKRHLDSLVDT